MENYPEELPCVFDGSKVCLSTCKFRDVTEGRLAVDMMVHNNLSAQKLIQEEKNQLANYSPLERVHLILKNIYIFEKYDEQSRRFVDCDQADNIA